MLDDIVDTGLNEALGFTLDEAGPDRVVLSWTVAAHHLQPYGIVHGGVHAGIIEAACSTGAHIAAMARGQSVVGLENSTSFITAVRDGTLHVVATPVTRGRRTQVWTATVTNDQGKVCATGRVRLLVLDANSDLAGKPVEPTRG
jgi:1,4-dihydroxy-2-naphthoyl-CoA hydrolase